MGKKCILIILDGWGIAANKSVSAIDSANKPCIDQLLIKYPHSKLDASAEAVGLPRWQMGNSEVGHLTIGAGRVIKQSLLRINDSIASGEFYQNQILLRLFSFAKQDNLRIHLIGLVSDGGVHSHISHAKAICTMANNSSIREFYLHAFTDGRDTAPGSAFDFLNEINDHMKQTTGTIASITGRYYAMDRDNRWERTLLAYNAMVKGIGINASNLDSAEKKLKSRFLTDEFFLPTVIRQKKQSPITIRNNDIVISFNFRADRMRQITHALTQKPIPGYSMTPLPLIYLSMTEYDSTYSNIFTIFPHIDTPDTLGEVLSENKKTQLRIAETEKYPHITYFLSGGKEMVVPRETRILCPSPKIPTYDKKPEMAALDITAKLLLAIQKGNEDFICVNFANTDMVGHTGNFSATVKACEVIDSCLDQIIPEALNNGYVTLIISDHGNAEEMIDKNGNGHTYHTLNKVPCILVSDERNIDIKDGTLADIAPTVLEIMGVEKPKAMTGESLVSF